MSTLGMLSFWSAVGYWVAGWFLFVGVKKLSEYPLRRRRPPVSVIIPARNEEQTLPRLLVSLRGQTGPPDEIIVVNDNSSDRTAQIAAQYGCRVVHVQSKPEEWTGKSWACWTGAEAATYELLLFLDADVWCGKEAISALRAVWLEHGGLVSVQPKHITEKFYEQCSAFFNIVSVAAAGRKGSFGPCMVCSKKDYFDSGGHKTVRDHVVDDVALAKQFLKKEKRVTPFMGLNEMKFRMYPGGILQLFEGWTKNMAAGATLTGFLSVILLFLWFTGIINSVTAVLFTALCPAYRLLAAALITYGAYVVQIHLLLRRVGRFFFTTALFYPFYFLFFLLLFFISIILTAVVGKVRWKGRVIYLRR